TDEIKPSDAMAAYRRREILSEILSIKPLSSMDWLSLSAMQLVTDRPMEQVVESLKLSVLTGPNEAYVMGQRAVLALSIWEDLSPDLKSDVVIDLGPMMSPRTPAEGAEQGKFRAVLATKSERVRTELRTALIATGLSPKGIDQFLGF